MGISPCDMADAMMAKSPALRKGVDVIRKPLCYAIGYWFTPVVQREPHWYTAARKKKTTLLGAINDFVGLKFSPKPESLAEDHYVGFCLGAANINTRYHSTSTIYRAECLENKKEKQKMSLGLFTAVFASVALSVVYYYCTSLYAPGETVGLPPAPTLARPRGAVPFWCRVAWPPFLRRRFLRSGRSETSAVGTSEIVLGPAFRPETTQYILRGVRFFVLAQGCPFFMLMLL